MNEDIYKKLWEVNSEGITAVYKLKEEVQEFKTVVLCHIEGDKARDEKMTNLIKIITVDNGRKSILTRLETVERYVAFVIGGAAVLGVIWGVIVFIVPLVIGKVGK